MEKVKITKKIVKAMAIEDMYAWIMNFENNGPINNYDEEAKNVYWDYIKKMQDRIIKEL